MAIFNSNKSTTFNPQEINIINAGTTITGDVTSEGDLRIDGTVTGNIQVKTKLVLGSSATVKGNIIANNCDVSGLVIGNIDINELLTIKATSKINGDIKSSKLIIEAGAEFNGKSSMLGNNLMSGNKTQNPIQTKTPVVDSQTKSEKATAI